MSQQSDPAKSAHRPWPVLGPDDPPFDYSREDAAYAKEAERLAREHLGKIALVYEDEVVGVFNDPDEAYDEATRRFGIAAKVMVRVIRDPKAPLDFIGLIDANHPSCRSVDRRSAAAHGEIHG
jgi:hypothetical protein